MARMKSRKEAKDKGTDVRQLLREYWENFEEDEEKDVRNYPGRSR